MNYTNNILFLSLLTLILVQFTSCSRKCTKNICEFRVDKIYLSELNDEYFVYVVGMLENPNRDSIYIPPYYPNRLCFPEIEKSPSYISMSIGGKQLNLEKLGAIGYLKKNSPLKINLWVEVKKNYLPVEEFKKNFKSISFSYHLEKDSAFFLKIARKKVTFESYILDKITLNDFKLSKDSSAYHFLDSLYIKRSSKSQKLIITEKGYDPLRMFFL